MSRLDPVLAGIAALVTVAVAGFALDRAAPSVQLVICWFVASAMHLALVAIVVGWGRIGRLLAVGGGLLAIGDLVILGFSLARHQAAVVTVMTGSQWLMTGTVLAAAVPAVLVRWCRSESGQAALRNTKATRPRRLA